MRVIIAGSRTLTGYDNYTAVVKGFAALLKEANATEVTEIITGGATGIDALGKKFAEDFGIAHREMKADWERHGGAAGPIRNSQMANAADALLLVWDGRSKGSKNMRMNAEKHGLLVYEVVL